MAASPLPMDFTDVGTAVTNILTPLGTFVTTTMDDVIIAALALGALFFIARLVNRKLRGR